MFQSRMTVIEGHNKHQETDQLYQPLRKTLLMDTTARKSQLQQATQFSHISHQIRTQTMAENIQLGQHILIPEDVRLRPTHNVWKIPQDHKYYIINAEQRVYGAISEEEMRRIVGEGGGKGEEEVIVWEIESERSEDGKQREKGNSMLRDKGRIGAEVGIEAWTGAGIGTGLGRREIQRNANHYQAESQIIYGEVQPVTLNFGRIGMRKHNKLDEQRTQNTTDGPTATTYQPSFQETLNPQSFQPPKNPIPEQKNQLRINIRPKSSKQIIKRGPGLTLTNGKYNFFSAIDEPINNLLNGKACTCPANQIVANQMNEISWYGAKLR